MQLRLNISDVVMAAPAGAAPSGASAAQPEEKKVLLN
jgi:hypothetical protein